MIGDMLKDFHQGLAGHDNAPGGSPDRRLNQTPP
jgi:hypothetical protein